MLWAKGHRLLLDYLKREAQQPSADGGPQTRTHVDVYGKGEDLGAVRAAAEEAGLDIDFYGPIDHASRLLHE